MSETTNSLCLQKRDEDLIRYLLQVQVASLKQIQRDLALNQERTYLCKRFGQLSRAGLLKKDWVEGRIVYSIGARALEFLFDQGVLKKAYDLNYLGFKSNQARHDYLLNDVYARLRTLPIVIQLKTANDLLMENEKTESFNLPDALIHLETSKKPWALELEIWRKSAYRYRKIFRSYVEDQEISGVLYLVRNKADIRALQNVDRKLFPHEPSSFFFAKIDDFLNNPLNTPFETSDNCGFSFRWSSMREKYRDLREQTFPLPLAQHPSTPMAHPVPCPKNA